MKRFFLMLTGCAVLSSTACGGDGGSPQPTNNTVSGKVVDSEGNPLANATVLVMGKTSVTSDASGAFSVSDVQGPYDIVAVRGDKQAAILYKGVTRKDPTLSILIEGTSTDEKPAYSGKITGKVIGARAPSATVTPPAVFFVSASGSGTPSAADASDFSFSTDVSWDGSTSLSGSLFAIQGESTSAGSDDTRFTGFGRRDNVTLGNSATLASQDITINPVNNSSIAGKISLPSGFSPLISLLSMQVSPGLELFLGGQLGSPPANFSYSVPVVPQTSFSFLTVAVAKSGAASIGTKTGLAAGATNANLDLKVPPTQTLPADKATGVAQATEFSWSGGQGGVNLAQFTKTTASAKDKPFTLTVVTSDSRVTLPDLSAVGMALPANTDFRWRAQSISPVTSVDSMLVKLGYGQLPSGLNEIYAGVSEYRAFKTAAAP